MADKVCRLLEANRKLLSFVRTLILPYYIMKDGESTLANELENMSDEEPVIENPNEDWTNTLL